MYNVRKLKIDQTEQLDALATASGELYSRTLVYFWRTVRKHGLWLKPSSMMRWQNNGEGYMDKNQPLTKAEFDPLPF